MDLFLLAAEPSADLHGARLISALQTQRPHLKIGAMAGPSMRKLSIEPLFAMEELQVMGFTDVLLHLPHIARLFYKMRDTLLARSPKAIVFLDYPGFNLRLAKSLRLHGYKGKLIHFICPTVWAWGKKRIPLMAKYLDLLLTLFPFEPAFFAHTSLPTHHVGHPLTQAIPPTPRTPRPLLALFPGSREAVIARNLPIQLAVAKRLLDNDPSLELAISAAPSRACQVTAIAKDLPHALISTPYSLMRECRLALATSGTVTLELALHKTPTLVQYAIRPFDQFLATHLFRIALPHYCIVNIVAQKEVFPEFFGSNLNADTLYQAAHTLWHSPAALASISAACEEVRTLLGPKDASQEAASHILTLLV